MTSTVPPQIAWPLIAFMITVVAVRYQWFNTSEHDRLYNATLAWLLVAQLLRERAVEDVLHNAGLISITTAGQLSFVAMMFSSTAFLGLTMLVANPAGPSRYRRYQLLTAVLAAGYLAAATRARLAGQTLEVTGGWDTVLAWTLYLSVLLILSAALLMLCYREFCNGSARRERIVVAGSLILGLAISFTSLQALVLAITDQLGLTDTAAYRLRVHGPNFFFEAVGACVLGAIPCVTHVLSYRGRDPISGSWHKLQPLRASMRQAVPESIFDLDTPEHTQRGRKTELQLHQVVVEIRDALLQLRPYTPDLPDDLVETFLTDNAVTPRHRDIAIRALRTAYAAQARSAGLPPQAVDADAVVASRSTTLDDEITDLLKLSRWWKTAEAASQAAPLWGANMKVSAHP